MAGGNHLICVLLRIKHFVANSLRFYDLKSFNLVIIQYGIVREQFEEQYRLKLSCRDELKGHRKQCPLQSQVAV